MIIITTMKFNLAYMLILTLSLAQLVYGEWGLFTTDLDENNFSTYYLNGWSYDQISSCSPNVSPPSLISGNHTTKVFYPLPPHFKARVSFELFIIDSIENPQNDLNEKFKLNADNLEVFNIRSSQIPTQSSSQDIQFWQCSSGNWCGSASSNITNPTQFNDWTCSFSVEFAHSSQSLQLEFFDTFIQNIQPYKSWGIRSLAIEINKCYERCNTCTGEWVNNCSSCSSTQFLSSNGSCQCLPSLYYLNFECQAIPSGLSTCDSSLAQAITEIVVLPSSVIQQHVDEPYLHISVEFSFNLTTSVVLEQCQSQLQASLLHRNYDVQTTTSYIQFSDSYTPYFAYNSSFPAGLQFNIPLNLAISNLSDTSYAGLSKIELSVSLGNSVEYLRQNRFLVYIQNSTTFAVNADPEITDGCNPTDDNCISMIGIATESFLCADPSCSTPRANTTFTVGDTLIVKIRFRDHSLQQFISLSAAYYKSENSLFNVTPQLQKLSSQNGYSIFAFDLLFPSKNCVLQLSLQFVDSLNTLRFLQTANQEAVVDNSNNFPSKQSSSQAVQIKSFTVNPIPIKLGQDILTLCMQSALLAIAYIFFL